MHWSAENSRTLLTRTYFHDRFCRSVGLSGFSSCSGGGADADPLRAVAAFDMVPPRVGASAAPAIQSYERGGVRARGLREPETRGMLCRPPTTLALPRSPPLR